MVLSCSNFSKIYIKLIVIICLDLVCGDFDFKWLTWVETFEVQAGSVNVGRYSKTL